MRYQDIITEVVGQLLLYHWMERDKARRVFSTDALRALFSRPDLGRGISLTRNKHYDQDWADGDHPIRLTLDRQLLAQHYKIVPIDAEVWRIRGRRKRFDFTDPKYQDVSDRGSRSGQFAEEFLIGNIVPLHRYVRSIYYRHAGHDDEPFLKALARFVTKYAIPLSVAGTARPDWHADYGYAAWFPPVQAVDQPN